MNDNSWSHGHQYEMAVSQEGTFGELTVGTLDGVADTLHKILGSKLKKCTVLDVGSGRGKLAMCIADRVSVRAVMGIELDATLHSFAQENSRCTQIIFAKGNLNNLTSFGGANIILGVCVSVVLCVCCC